MLLSSLQTMLVKHHYITKHFTISELVKFFNWWKTTKIGW